MSNEWERSGVMSEFLKIASEAGLISPDLKQNDGVGNPVKETPVEGHTRYESTEEYKNKTEPENIIDKAHPKPSWMADNSTPVHSMGEGSLVENIKEQQEKDIEIATKMPHGTLIGVHANLINNLVKLANKFEDDGKTKEALCIDKIISKICNLHFNDGRLRKEAGVGWFLIPFLLASGYTGIKFFGSELTSRQENLRIDLEDLYDKLNEKSSLSKSASSASKIIASFISRLEEMDLSTKEGSDRYAKIISDLGPALKRVGSLIMAMKQDIKRPTSFFGKLWTDVRNIFGFEDYKLMVEKFQDVEDSYKEAREFVVKAKRIESNILNEMDIGGGVSISSILAGGFRGKKYSNLEELEEALNIALKELYDAKKISKPLSADIVRNGKLTSTPQKLKEVLEIVEQKLSA